MLKKLGAILVVAVLIVSLAACAGTPTPVPVDPETRAFEMYTEIMQRLSFGEDNPSGAYDIDVVMDMEMTMFGETISVTSTGNLQMVVDGDNSKSVMIMTSDMGELGTMEMEIYMVIEDNTLTEFGFFVDGEDMSAFIPMDMMQAMMDDAINMPDLYMEGLTSVEIDEVDGNTVMHLVLDGEMFTDFMMETMDGMMEGMFAELGQMDFAIEVEDIKITIVVDSADNPLSMSMDMQMSIEVEGETLDMVAVIEYTFNAFGDDVNIVLPL